MASKITISILKESVDGDDIGSDWTYKVQAEVQIGDEPTRGEIVVPKHTLRHGTSQTPDVGPIAIAGGACGERTTVKLRLWATEVDLVVDDDGYQSTEVTVDCPGPGNPASVVETVVEAKVDEAWFREKSLDQHVPRGTAVLAVTVRLETVCE
jgi:hypothetical protein